MVPPPLQALFLPLTTFYEPVTPAFLQNSIPLLWLLLSRKSFLQAGNHSWIIFQLKYQTSGKLFTPSQLAAYVHFAHIMEFSDWFPSPCLSHCELRNNDCQPSWKSSFKAEPGIWWTITGHIKTIKSTMTIKRKTIGQAPFHNSIQATEIKKTKVFLLKGLTIHRRIHL